MGNYLKQKTTTSSGRSSDAAGDAKPCRFCVRITFRLLG